MTTGKELKFTSKVYANAYEEENSDMIADTLIFDTESEYKQHQANGTSDNPGETTTGEILSPNDKKALARLKRYRLEHCPTRSISTLYKTSVFSDAIPLVFDVLDISGNTFWIFKEADFHANMQAFVNESGIPVQGKHTKEIMNNMVLLERRDKEKGDNDILKNKAGYVQYKAVSYFILPRNPEINTMELEEKYIEEQLLKFGNDMKKFMTSPLYNASLKEHINSYAPNWAKLVFSPQKGPSLTDFVKACSVTVGKIKDYTDHIIKDKVPVLRGMIAMHDNPIPKYINDSDIEDCVHQEEPSRYAKGFNVDTNEENEHNAESDEDDDEEESNEHIEEEQSNSDDKKEDPQDDTEETKTNEAKTDG